MDTFHPFCTLFQKHSFQPFSTLKEYSLYITVDVGYKNIVENCILQSICLEQFDKVCSNRAFMLFNQYGYRFVFRPFCRASRGAKTLDFDCTQYVLIQ